LARKAGASGVKVTLAIWPDMIHAWHLFYQQLEAGREALAEVGAFVRANVAPEAPIMHRPQAVENAPVHASS